MEILADEKISIYKPKKDQCDTCLGYKHGSVSKEIYDEHQMKKEEGRRAKENDKVTAKHVYTMDVEAVLLCPRTRASAMYYHRKLAVHNFTIYNLKTADAHCFLWDETVADLSASVFASMLVNFIVMKILFQEGDEIIFFSDGCTYQNRNSVLADALLDVAIIKKIYII